MLFLCIAALTWPLVLTKLGYLIDNPWSNALDRSKAAGLILADVLARRQLGVRPITLIGFSLGARSIFYALIELARIKAFGVVQNVYLMGTPVTASDKVWKEARSVVAGRFVNGECTGLSECADASCGCSADLGYVSVNQLSRVPTGSSVTYSELRPEGSEALRACILWSEYTTWRTWT